MHVAGVCLLCLFMLGLLALLTKNKAQKPTPLQRLDAFLSANAVVTSLLVSREPAQISGHPLGSGQRSVLATEPTRPPLSGCAHLPVLVC